MESNKLDTFFKNKIDGHVEPVTANAWESVQLGLKAKKSKKKPALWYIAASISILLISTLSIYNYYNSNNSKEDLAISKIDLDSNQIALNDRYGNHLSTPRIGSNDTDESVNSTMKTNSINQATTLNVNTKPLNEKQYQRSTAELPKLTSLPIVINQEDEPLKVASFKKIESDIMVNINYVAQAPEKINELKQTTNRIKSLASELNLADLRSAKNELFASALTFEKKHNN